MVYVHTLKIGMIGIGVGGAEILPAMEAMDTVKVVAGADIVPATLERFAERFPEARTYDSAEALCRAAKLLGWRTVVADARASFATPERIPSADELLALWPDDALARVQPDVDTAVLVLTHDDKFDLPLVEAVLRTDAFYVGWLGSRRNQERRRGLLLERGIDEEELDRIAGPSGLDIGAATPAETALSMLAEILAVRAGRSGGRLKDSSHRIHAEPVA